MTSSRKVARFRRLGPATAAALVLTLVLTVLTAPVSAAGSREHRRAPFRGASVSLPITSPAGRTGAGSVTYTQPTTYRGIHNAPATTAPVVKTVLSETGTHPDVYVDEAGTGHIVWNEGRGDDADATYYCRLKRGATACDHTAVLTWDKTYGAGDGPEYNTDYDGPKIVRVGDQLLVLSHRYPTVADKPDGGSSNNTIGWVSNDGGSTWSGGVIMGKRSLGQLAVIASGNSPTVVNVGYDALCGGMCVTAYRSGSYQGAEGVINADVNSNYYGTLANTSTGMIAGMADAGGTMWMKQWNGSGPVTDPASWASTSSPFPGAEPDLATGPSGTFLLSRVDLVGGRRMQRVGPGLTLTDPVSVTKRSSYEGLLDEDPGGGLRTVWTDSGDNGGLHMRSATSPSAGFDQPRTLLTGDRTGQPELSATDDGGGFVVANATGWISDPGRIVAIGVGTPGPTGKPGLGDLPGGGNVSCTNVGFGSFEVQTVSGCFLNGVGDAKGMVVTSAPITLNGLELEPLNGAEIILDPDKLRLDTTGPVRVLLRDADAEVELFRGEIHRDLANLQPGSQLFEFPQDLYQANVLGFPLASGVPIELTQNGVRIPVEIQLPAEFGGFTGKATLLGEEGKGLQLESLHVSIGPIPLGVAWLDNVSLNWTAGGTWDGTGKLTVPAGGTIEATIQFEAGDFAGAHIAWDPPPPGVTIGPFVYLTQISGGFDLQPDLQVQAGAQIGAGLPIRELQPVRIDGTFTMTFPSGAPAKFEVNADIGLLGMSIGNGNFRFLTNGYAAFDGASSVELGPVSGNVNVNGFVDATGGQFGARATGKLDFCATLEDPTGALPSVDVCAGAGADFAVSSIGFAACGIIDSPFGGQVSVGLEQRWDKLSPGVLLSPYVVVEQLLEAFTLSCDAGDYAIAPPARSSAARAVRAAGGAALVLPAGLPSATFLVPGQGGTPEFTLTGPDGEVLVGPGATGNNVSLVTLSGSDAQWVSVTKPAAGTYTVTPDASSVPIGEVQVSHSFTPASVKGSVKGRVITYSTKHLTDSQGVTFRESGEFGTNILGTADDKSGTFRIKPASGPGGKRVVEALLTHQGVVKRIVRLGTYVAPQPPAAGKVTHLVVAKKGSNVKVSFKPAKHAARTEVLVKGNAGSEVARVLTGKEHKLSVAGFTWDTRLRVTVTTYGPDGARGKVTSVKTKVPGPR